MLEEIEDVADRTGDAERIDRERELGNPTVANVRMKSSTPPNGAVEPG
jgi:hypothetical protein